MESATRSDAGRSTRALLAAADRLAAEGDATDFERTYRAWITEHHFVDGDLPDQRQDKVRLLLLAMLNGRDLGGALAIMPRFARHAIGQLGPVAIVDDGAYARVEMEFPLHPGVEGLIGELWALAFHRSQLEFLTGRVLPGVTGEVRHGPLLEAHVETFLFGRPVVHGARTLSLCVPLRHLDLPVVVGAEQVFGFVHKLLPSASGPPGHMVEVAGLVEAMLRVDMLRLAPDAGRQAAIAGRIGVSPATLKRRLAGEGASFRDLRARVQDEVAKRWLGDRSASIARVAEQLGYGDAYSFRRAFARANGCSPAAYRRKALGQDVRSGARG